MERKRKRELYIATFVLLALYLSLLESLIPKPFPWMKFGFSNIIILVILEKWDKKMAFEVLLLRIFIQALMLGTMFSPGFLVSLCSGFLSLCLTTILYRARKYLSRSEEHTSELQSRQYLVCRLLLEKTNISSLPL